MAGILVIEARGNYASSIRERILASHREGTRHLVPDLSRLREYAAERRTASRTVYVGFEAVLAAIEEQLAGLAARAQRLSGRRP